MRTTGYYQPQMNCWCGRTDHTTDTDFYRVHQVIQPLNLNEEFLCNSERSLCLLGFASDEGVRRNNGQQGASEGPATIRAAMANLPWHWGHVDIYDAGDVVCSNRDLEKAEDLLASSVEKICTAGAFPLVLGGGHEVAFGHYNGLKRFYKNDTIGIINFDAHFDIRAYAEGMSSGTMFAQIADNEKDFKYFCLGIQKAGNTRALFKKAEELGIKYQTADEISEKKDLSELHKFINQSDRIYLTLCFDVISSAFAPGVSAPQPFGLDPKDIRHLIRDILRTRKVAGFDIAEVAPKLDVGGKTSKLAAHIIFNVIDEFAKAY